MTVEEFIRQMNEDPEEMYHRVVRQIAEDCILVAEFHGKTLEQFGQDLNRAVEEIKEAEAEDEHNL